MKDLLENEAPFNGKVIREAKTALDDLSDKIKDKIQEERKLAIQKVENKIALIKYKEEFLKLDKSNQNLILAPFTDEIKKLIKDLENALRVKDNGGSVGFGEDDEQTRWNMDDIQFL